MKIDNELHLIYCTDVYFCYLLVSTYFGEPTIGTSAECVKWRQTGGCKFDGPREPENDKNCEMKVEWKSGYCECKDGRKTMKKGCDLPVFMGLTMIRAIRLVQI